MSPPSASRTAATARVWIDAAGYTAVLASVATLGALAVGIASGGGFVRGKILTFLAGWVLIAYGTVRLWPSAPDEDGEVLRGTRQTRFQRFVRRIPPLRWVRSPPPTERVRPARKILLSGVVTLAASLVMEVGFGIA